jgi:hypothetical protein
VLCALVAHQQRRRHCGVLGVGEKLGCCLSKGCRHQRVI